METLNFDSLTEREREITDAIIAGKSTRDIARELCIGAKTVETHRSKINKKLGVHSPAELIRRAFVDKEPARPDRSKRAVAVVVYQHGQDLVVHSRELRRLGSDMDGQSVRVTVEPMVASSTAPANE